MIHQAIQTVLYTEEEIRKRITELCGEIHRRYGDSELTLISITNGSVIFTADLLRHLPNPTRLDCIRVTSYKNETQSFNIPEYFDTLSLNITGRHVLVVDDIIDSGKTLLLIKEVLASHKPASLRLCVLLDKAERREVPIEADFVGFRVPNEFVVGYGLDFAERYRNLPYIGTLKPEYRKTTPEC